MPHRRGGCAVRPGAALTHAAGRSRVGANASAALAAVLFGASVVAVRIAVRDVPPLTLAFFRFAQGTLVLFLALAMFRRQLLRVDRSDLPFLALLGVLLFTIFPVTFNAGLRYIEASRAALIVATMPLLTVIIGRLLTRAQFTARQLLGVSASVAGVAIVMIDRGGAGAGSVKGDLLLLTTALCGAIYNVLVKRVLTRYAGLTVTCYAMLFGTLLLFPASLIESGISVTAWTGETLATVVFLGVLGGALGFSLWTAALKELTPTEVAVYINLNPLVATLLAATMLRERLSGSFVIGFVGVVSGVMIVNWRGSPTRGETNGAQTSTDWSQSSRK